MTHPTYVENPELDLVLERTVDVPPERVWQAWTDPEMLKRWFVPRPWSLAECRLDLRPGGEFTTVMRDPEGEEFPSTGCFLEVVENERLVFTDALGPGYRPNAEPFMTAVVTFTAENGGTRYVARALHNDVAAREKHVAMGFHDGWGQAWDQLVALLHESDG